MIPRHYIYIEDGLPSRSFSSLADCDTVAHRLKKFDSHSSIIIYELRDNQLFYLYRVI